MSEMHLRQLGLQMCLWTTYKNHKNNKKIKETGDVRYIHQNKPG